MPECAADEVHYPGTYVAGCCNRLTSNVAGRQVENEDMANVPNWLPLRFRLHEEQWLTPGTATVLDHHQILHLDSGLLERRTRYGLGAGRALAVRQQRLVHMADPHLAALRTEFTAEGFAGELEVEATLGGDVTNAGVPRCRDLDGRHLTHVHTGTDTADTVWLRCRTRTSDIRIAMASRLTADEPATVRHDGPRVSPSTRLLPTPGRTVTVDKTVALHTSRDPAISDPLQAALARVGRAPDFDELLDTWLLLSPGREGTEFADGAHEGCEEDDGGVPVAGDVHQVVQVAQSEKPGPKAALVPSAAVLRGRLGVVVLPGRLGARVTDPVDVHHGADRDSEGNNHDRAPNQCRGR